VTCGRVFAFAAVVDVLSAPDEPDLLLLPQPASANSATAVTMIVTFLRRTGILKTSA
jgi:hypothetical protein